MTIIKWLGTILLVLANVFRAFNMHMLDMTCTLLGAGLWTYAAHRAKDGALFAVNIIAVLLMIVGIYNEGK